MQKLRFVLNLPTHGRSIRVTDHVAFDYASVFEQSQLIVDTRNAFKKFKSDKVPL